MGSGLPGAEAFKRPYKMARKGIPVAGGEWIK